VVGVGKEEKSGCKKKDVGRKRAKGEPKTETARY